MSSNFMTHKPNDIAQLFQMTTKFDKLRLKFKYGWWRHPSPLISQIFFSSVLDDLQK